LKTGLKYILESKKIVVTAGPYTGAILNNIAPYFKRLILPKRVPVIYFKMKPEIYFKLSDSQRKRLTSYYPIIDMTEELMYSMIENKDQNGIPIIKIGAHFKRSQIEDLDRVWEKEVSKEEIKWGINKTVEYLNRINISVQSQDLDYVNGYSCVYSLSEKEIPYVTNILDKDNQQNLNAVVIAAMSGIGAKGAMAYGRLGADLILQREIQDEMYSKVKVALGYERMLMDLKLHSK
jgi:glycine/D-amino acid oxidase-like deaminating enzyme